MNYLKKSQCDERGKENVECIDLESVDETSGMIFQKSMNRYTIIIPVYGAFEQLKKCLTSVLKNTDLSQHQLLVIDDASKDAEVVRYLASNKVQIESFWFEGLILHDKNVGFVVTANEGIRWAIEHGTDPILLNSDTMVPEGWIERLDSARSVSAKVASVSPLAAYGWLNSIPLLDKSVPYEAVDDFVQTLPSSYPEVPCSVGFCMLMTREAIAEIGFLDESFSPGYGEETDWCQRARAAGYSCILCDNLFLHHEGESSFRKGERISRHKERMQEAIRRRWPLFADECYEWYRSASLVKKKLQIMDAMRARPIVDKRPRILHVIHDMGGEAGLQNTLRAVVRNTQDMADHLVLIAKGFDRIADIDVRGADGITIMLVSAAVLDPAILCETLALSVSNPPIEHLFGETLEALHPDSVVFWHLGGFGSFKLPSIAYATGVRVVTILCDDYLLCPRWRRDCKMRNMCCSGGDECLNCVEHEMRVLKRSNRQDLVETLEVWFAAARTVLAASHLIMGEPRVMRDVCVEGENLPKGITRHPVVQCYRPQDELRVAYVGNANIPKGWLNFVDAMQRKYSRPIKWLRYGGIQGDLPMIDEVDGRAYSSSELPQILQSVDLAVCASMVSESYCGMADEILAAGCPIVARLNEALEIRYPMNDDVWYYEDSQQLYDIIEMFATIPAEELVRVRGLALQRAEHIGDERVMARRYVERFLA